MSAISVRGFGIAELDRLDAEDCAWLASVAPDGLPDDKVVVESQGRFLGKWWEGFLCLVDRGLVERAEAFDAPSRRKVEEIIAAELLKDMAE